MKILQTSAAVIALSLSMAAAADSELTKDAAISGAIGGALGGAVGAELGGKEGAVIGAGVGAAVGTSIGTQDSGDHHEVRRETEYRRTTTYTEEHNHSSGSFCPPGQAKKGRC